MTQDSSFLTVFLPTDSSPAPEERAEEGVRTSAERTGSCFGQLHRKKQRARLFSSSGFTSSATSELLHAFHALSSTEDWTRECRAALGTIASTAMMKLTFTECEMRRLAISKYTKQIPSGEHNTEKNKATSSPLFPSPMFQQ